jgi:hypothetical protein
MNKTSEGDNIDTSNPQKHYSTRNFQNESDEEYDQAVLAQIDTIISDYFSDTRELVEHEEAVIFDNSLETPKIDFFRLRRFLFTAFRNLYQIDDKFSSGLLVKIYNNVKSMIEHRNYFVKYNTNSEVIYQKLFIEKLIFLKKLSEERTVLSFRKSRLETSMDYFDQITKELLSRDAKSSEVLDRLKQNKRRYADVVHEYDLTRKRLDVVNEEMYGFEKTYKYMFLTIFAKTRDDLSKRLLGAINCKAGYLDKIIWDCASKSILISEFFINSCIEGNYETKTFVKYYIKNINSEDSSDKEWHKYLEEVARMLS